MSRDIDIATAGGVMDAQVFTQAGSATALPPVVLFTDIGGLRPGYAERAQRIADGGYAVLLPNIYYRTGRGQVMPGRELGADVMPVLLDHAAHLTREGLDGDFDAVMRTVDGEPEFGAGPVGAVGYCMTGGFPVRLASRFPDRVGAAAGYHSAGLATDDGVRGILDSVPAVTARVYFGHADQDPHLDADQIGTVDRLLARAGVHFATELFRGTSHGFTIFDSAAYDQEADALHLKRLFTLLEETIAAGVGSAPPGRA